MKPFLILWPDGSSSIITAKSWLDLYNIADTEGDPGCCTFKELSGLHLSAGPTDLYGDANGCLGEGDEIATRLKFTGTAFEAWISNLSFPAWHKSLVEEIPKESHPHEPRS